MSMTDEEVEALDEEFTNGSLKLGEGTVAVGSFCEATHR
jgi:hypothetical protein